MMTIKQKCFVTIAAGVVVLAASLSLAFSEGGVDSIRVCNELGCRYVNGLPVAKQEAVQRIVKGKKVLQARKAPTQTRQASGNVRSKNGKWAVVGQRYAPRFQCLVDGLEANGYHIDFIGGNRAGTCHEANQHACGMAMDVNQTARDKVTRRFPANTNKIAKACGLLHGDRTVWTRAPDQGHFQVLKSVADTKIRPWIEVASTVMPEPRPIIQASINHGEPYDRYDDHGYLWNKIKRLMTGYTFARLPEEKKVHAVKLAAAAKAHGVDPVYQLSMSYMESSFNPSLQARTSSAFGLCQLLKYERLHVYKIGMRPSVEQQVEACALKTKENTNLYRDIFQAEPSIEDLYLVHWQGIGGAVLLKMAGPDDNVESVLNKWQFYPGHTKDYGTWVVKANPTLKGKTVSQYFASIKKRTAYAIQLVSIER